MLLTIADEGYGEFNNGTSFFIRRPQYCLNDSYIPFCISLDQNNALTLCAIDRNDSGKVENNVWLIMLKLLDLLLVLGATTYPIIGNVSDFGTNEVASTVISNLTCSKGLNFDCSTKTSVNNDGCSGFADEAIITCISCMLYYST